MILSLRKRVTDFVDDDIGFNPFTLPLEVEKNPVTERREQHGINIRKVDVVAFVKESVDFGGEGYPLGHSEFLHRGGRSV